MHSAIVVSGPESSGKTTLSRSLSKALKLPLVEEYAREYLSKLGSEYTFDDVIKMARVQLGNEKAAIAKYNGRCILDTDLSVYKLWIGEKYRSKVPWIEEALKEQTKKIYLLCDTGLEWEQDILREHPKPEDRERIFIAHQHILQVLRCEYYVVKGKGEERTKNALEFIEKLI